MIEKIIEWCVKNRFIMVLCTVFVIVAGILSMAKTPIDAIPDLSDVQVIIYTEYPGQGPQVVEDQVTYPLTTAMLSVPFARWSEDIPFSVTHLSTSSLRTGRIFTGPVQGSSNI